MSEDVDLRVRTTVYNRALRAGAIPSISEIAGALSIDSDEVRGALSRLAAGRVLVLQEDGEVLMANPFSAVPTGFAVKQADRFTYGNCIWDAMGVLAMTGEDGTIEASCGDCGTALTLTVTNGRISGDATGLVHFAIPARHWWDDIVFN